MTLVPTSVFTIRIKYSFQLVDNEPMEVVFFVSRSADRVVLRSHRIQLDWDHYRDAIFASDTKLIGGTLVEFEIEQSTRRHLWHGLDKFSVVELDMRGVKSVGQGYVDEVFCVFAKRHPGISIRATNTRPSVDAMIRRTG